MFKVSVIIPVYNAEKYLRQAVESAISIEEVGEVILIEDKSPDKAIEICRKLEEEHDKVYLYQHPNGRNRGPGASRNLGIKKAKYNYIAFLDADDWYLPNRFEIDKLLFSNPKVDGVYHVNENFHEETGKLEDDPTNIRIEINPNDLFYHLSFYTHGHFNTNTITVKKEIIEKLGGFDEELWLHQDSFLWNKLAFHSKLYSGNLKNAVAVRRVHNSNRIKKRDVRSRNKYLTKKMVYFFQFPSLSKEIKKRILMDFLSTTADKRWLRYIISFFYLLRHPKYILSLIK